MFLFSLGWQKSNQLGSDPMFIMFYPLAPGLMFSLLDDGVSSFFF